ncbi:unnamed protein product, partial [Laminaria digitata]
FLRHRTQLPRQQALEAEQAAETANGAATGARQEKEMAKAAALRERRRHARRQKLEAEQAAETANGAATDARQEKEMTKAATLRERRRNAQRERRRSSVADARVPCGVTATADSVTPEDLAAVASEMEGGT